MTRTATSISFCEGFVTKVYGPFQKNRNMRCWHILTRSASEEHESPEFCGPLPRSRFGLVLQCFWNGPYAIMSPMKILFLHGWQSTPGGRKPTYLKDHGHGVLNPALPDDDFDTAVKIAQAEYDEHDPDVVVGSSRGGAVAMNIDGGNTPLVLLCPAWKTWGTATTVKWNTTILHSEADETVPCEDSRELLKNSGLPESALIVIGTEHRLADGESLEAMVKACGQVAEQD